MDINSIFSISGSGMNYQKQKLEVVAMNMANINTTKSSSGEIYKPLEVTTRARSFNDVLQNHLKSSVEYSVIQRPDALKQVFNPSHPNADTKGYVEMPNINSIDEMTTLMQATRAYEANIQVLKAAKLMALKALEIGV